MSVINAPFARNRMCVAALVRLGPTANNLLDRMLSPDVRLATSTPGGDPGGDYASRCLPAPRQCCRSAWKIDPLRG